MAPEQFSGALACPGTELWGLGCTLARLLTRAPPVAAGSLTELSSRLRAGDWEPGLRSLLDRGGAMARVLGACLELEPARRHDDVKALRTALGQVIQASLVPDPREELSRTVREWLEEMDPAVFRIPEAAPDRDLALQETLDAPGPSTPAAATPRRRDSGDAFAVTESFIGDEPTSKRRSERTVAALWILAACAILIVAVVVAGRFLGPGASDEGTAVEAGTPPEAEDGQRRVPADPPGLDEQARDWDGILRAALSRSDLAAAELDPVGNGWPGDGLLAFGLLMDSMGRDVAAQRALRGLGPRQRGLAAEAAAVLACREGNAATALAQVDRALAGEPQDAATLLRQRAWKVRILGALGRYDEALRLADDCRGLNAAPDRGTYPGQPPRPEAWAAVLALRDPDRARALADLAVRRRALAPEAWLALGLSARYQEDDAAEAEAKRRYGALNPAVEWVERRCGAAAFRPLTDLAGEWSEEKERER